ncbi:MAG TPA: DUF1326 domain-containing protein [Candidatus Binatia bacterium]
MGAAWSIEGEYLEACSCRYLCPCVTSNATARASEDFCDFAMTYRIDAGGYGGVDLQGVTFVVVAQSQAVMAAGGWIVGLIVDEAASAAQADAIAAIVSGRAGGPMAALAPLIGEFRGVERHPIRVEIDGNRRAVVIAGVLEQRVEGVPSVSAAGECLAIDNTFHPANRRLNLATAVRNLIACFGIRWDDPGSQRNGHFASFAWSGSA